MESFDFTAYVIEALRRGINKALEDYVQKRVLPEVEKIRESIEKELLTLSEGVGHAIKNDYEIRIELNERLSEVQKELKELEEGLKALKDFAVKELLEKAMGYAESLVKSSTDAILERLKELGQVVSGGFKKKDEEIKAIEEGLNGLREDFKEFKKLTTAFVDRATEEIEKLKEEGVKTSELLSEIKSLMEELLRLREENESLRRENENLIKTIKGLEKVLKEEIAEVKAFKIAFLKKNFPEQGEGRDFER